MRVKEFESSEELQAYLEVMQSFSTSTPIRVPRPSSETQPTNHSEKNREDESARMLG
jgi:hypothetical protein